MSNDNKYKNQLENCYKIIGASDSSSKIVLLKGGSYKIKQYYLEDNVPRDIRGASMNLAYVEEKVIPNYIEKVPAFPDFLPPGHAGTWHTQTCGSLQFPAGYHIHR